VPTEPKSPGVPDDAPVTRLLAGWRAGDRKALDELMEIVYDQLRVLARSRLRAERPDHTIQTTALVHEAFIRLAGTDVAWKDRVHFFAVIARTMRRVLVDHARARNRSKRGGAILRVTLSEAPGNRQSIEDILIVDGVLEQLAAQDARKSTLLELHVFGGLSAEELAEVVDLSAVTVRRDLALAKAWLKRELAHR
jgi:RNA polymerase sigma factor (TIGR02999 family)